jgi:hypothetical protein
MAKAEHIFPLPCIPFPGKECTIVRDRMEIIKLQDKHGHVDPEEARHLSPER